VLLEQRAGSSPEGRLLVRFLRRLGPRRLVFHEKRASMVLCLAASVGLVHPASARADAFLLETTSRVVIHVGKAGAFGFAGHAHDVAAPVSGSVTVDPSDPARSQVQLEFDSASLRVTGEGEPARDVPEVQRVMLSERVLDVARYPTIVFRSRRVTSKGGTGGTLALSVDGDLTLHGATKPCVVVVRVTLSGNSLTAEGAASIKQSDFGIEPVTAAGGTIRVSDALDVTFTIHAVRAR
jgi:polyisoprenoid-binding protein YceI